MSETENKITTDPQSFWKYVRLYRTDNGIPLCLNYNDQVSDNVEDTVGLFSHFFSSVYGKQNESKNGELVNVFSCSSNVNVNGLNIGISDILEHLSNIDVKKNPGPDGIAPIFIKNCAFALSRPLWLIYNKSLSLGVFPNVWKMSFVFPIYKNKAQEMRLLAIGQ